MTKEKVGVIGVGAMGSAMAANLVAAGFHVIGFDVRRERLDLLTRSGGEAADSAADVARRTDAVILSLPSEQALAQAVNGEAGIVEGASRDLVCIETSTLPIAAKGSARDSLAAVGAVLLDCPISGTGDQARVRDIVVYASGPLDEVERCRPVFDAFARAAFRVGDFGSGSQMKFISNLLVSIHTLAAAEALTLAARCGLDLELAHRLLTSGAGTSRMLEVRGPRMVSGRHSDASATIDVLSKDVEIILDFAGGVDCPTPLLSVTSSYFAAARGQGHGGSDPSVLAEVLIKMSGGATT